MALFRTLSFLAVLFALFPPLPALAGLEKAAATCDSACAEALADFAPRYFTEHAPVLATRPERFEAPSAAAACPVRSQTGPAVFGVMIGPGEIEGFTPLKGPANDIQLMGQVMAERGVGAAFISSVEGAAANRAGMLAAMAAPLACLRERDQLVLIYSGWGTIYPYEWFDHGDFMQSFCTAASTAEAKAVCEAVTSSEVSEDYLTALRAEINRSSVRWLNRTQPDSNMLPGGRQHVLIGSGSKASDKGTIARLDGITASDMSNFVTRVRNLGADAFLIIDTRLAASADLLALQQQAASPAGWAVYGNTMIANNGFPAIQDEMNARGPVPLFGTGHYAVLYASTPDGEAFEYTQGTESKQLGALVFRVAEALRAASAVKFKDLSLTIAKSFAARNLEAGAGYEQEPVFMASNLDVALLAPRAQPAQRKTGGIEIISPAPIRGMTAVEEKTLLVAARYTGVDRAQMAIIDGALVPVDANGQFRAEVSDADSKFTIALRVLGANYETLAATDLKLRDKPADPVISAPARRVALVIANETYADPAFPPLATPVADAEAVVALLTGRYGFTTKLDGNGETLDLFLRNASKVQIQEALFELRRRLTAEDQLLIYYAGHGENDPDLGAYWVPVDGQPGADFTWIDAGDITGELKRMNAAAVLVISDSCYAGGLSRGTSAAAPDAAARDRYLAKASRLKSRQLMASGGEEPVADGGGGGHSVFAKALIEALQAMPEQTFTASELFEQKVKPAVISAANALSEGQTPGFSRISKAGDEPGSEFVFQAAAALP